MIISMGWVRPVPTHYLCDSDCFYERSSYQLLNCSGGIHERLGSMEPNRTPTLLNYSGGIPKGSIDLHGEYTRTLLNCKGGMT